MIASGEQLYAKFLLQIGDLTGQSRLRYMKLLRSTGDVLFPCHCKKIAKYTKFHFYPSKNSISACYFDDTIDSICSSVMPTALSFSIIRASAFFAYCNASPFANCNSLVRRLL